MSQDISHQPVDRKVASESHAVGGAPKHCVAASTHEGLESGESVFAIQSSALYLQSHVSGRTGESQL